MKDFFCENEGLQTGTFLHRKVKHAQVLCSVRDHQQYRLTEGKYLVRESSRSTFHLRRPSLITYDIGGIALPFPTYLVGLLLYDSSSSDSLRPFETDALAANPCHICIRILSNCIPRVHTDRLDVDGDINYKRSRQYNRWGSLPVRYSLQR